MYIIYIIWCCKWFDVGCHDFKISEKKNHTKAVILILAKEREKKMKNNLHWKSGRKKEELKWPVRETWAGLTAEKLALLSFSPVTRFSIPSSMCGRSRAEQNSSRLTQKGRLNHYFYNLLEVSMVKKFYSKLVFF